MDGCFDMMHYGHANALRQAKALGDELVVGLVPDAEIRRCKGPPLMDDTERLKMVEGVKWVDEVITGVPYDLTPAFLEELVRHHRIDVIIHGDDPCLLPDGTDAYAEAKRAGRFRVIKRTEGVSTTDVVGRLLMCMRDPGARQPIAATAELTDAFSRYAGPTGSESASISASFEGRVFFGGNRAMSRGARKEADTAHIIARATPNAGDLFGDPLVKAASLASTSSGASEATAAATRRDCPPPLFDVAASRFMPTTRRIVQFSSGTRQPAGGRIAYIDGAFDLFHVGHVGILKVARAQADFLLVGVHGDAEVAGRRGPHRPVFSLHERALSVLACRSVDEVIIGAPVVMTEDMLTTFGITLVVRGTVHDSASPSGSGGAGGSGFNDTLLRPREHEERRYAVPCTRGILHALTSPSSMTSATLIAQIVANRGAFEARQMVKGAAEAAYYGSTKAFVEEV
jgi:ethanolamine-phosphate cytidylyltransferase